MRFTALHPFLIFQLVTSLVVSSLYGGLSSAPTLRRVGGGYANAGMSGEYFANPDLGGTPAFARKEVRINFDWGTLLPIGGSTAKAYATFPHDNFSARWTGAVIPRFSEPYTFVAEADEGVRVRIRAADAPAGAWTTLIDAWSKAGAQTSKPFPMAAEKTYELQVEYRHLTGPALCRLSWQSPSTPPEVIDVVADNGLNLATYEGTCFADQSRTARWFKALGTTSEGDSFDENGSPKQDAEYLLYGGKGTWQIEFNGKADVSTKYKSITFVVNGKEYSKVLPRGEGYDPERNLTRFQLVFPDEDGLLFLDFTKTSRDGSDSDSPTGVTNFHAMRPIAAGSDTPHSTGEIVCCPMKKMAECFTCMRWLDMANGFGYPVTKWEERTPADFPQFRKQRKVKDTSNADAKPQSLGENYELLIMFANETGRDLYLTSPILADNEYFLKLAKLIKYGSDGQEPYNEPQAKPKYPPLNPNLRVYIEVGNEIWNWSFPSSKQAQQVTTQEIQNQTEESKVFNYNGSGNYRAWHALRTVRASDGFRSVFGDAAMGDRVRFLLEYQYADANSTGINSMQFIDGWFNNGDGQHVPNPHPVDYFVWGAGGAAYYGVGNGEGEQDKIQLADHGFEQPLVADGVEQTNINGPSWKFKGGAAIYRNLTSAIASYQLKPDTKQITQGKNTAIGFKFRTKDKPVYVYCAGRVFTGNSKGAHMTILRASDKSVVFQSDTVSAGSYLAKTFGYYFSPITEKPTALEPKTDYYIFAADADGGSRLAGDDTTASASPEIELLNAAKATGEPTKPESWSINDTKPGCVFGPVTFLCSTQPDLKPSLPQPPEGQQAAILRGEGEFSQTLNFPQTGDFALSFNETTPVKGDMAGGVAFDIFMDDQKISPRAGREYRAAGPNDHAQFGGFGRTNGFKEEWGSAVFHITAPGPHTIRFVSAEKSKSTSYAVIDNIRIMSADAIMESGFGAGSALGQPVENAWNERQRYDSQICRSFGLARVCYEAGWSLGGDFYSKIIQNYIKYMDPRAGKINDVAIQNMNLSGVDMPVWGVYTYWPISDFEHGKDFAIMKSIIASSNRLPAEADNGLPVPATLTPANSLEKFRRSADKKTPLNALGDWVVWTIICPVTGDYMIAPAVKGGGKFLIEVDGNALPAAASPGAAQTVKLTKGIHGIRFRRGEGEITLTQLEVKPAR